MKNKTAACYIVCCSFAVLFVLLYVYIPSPDTYIASLAVSVLTKGGLAGACFLYVMYAGALPVKSRLRKKLLPIRKQLSIMGSVLAFGHAAAYGSAWLLRFFISADTLRIGILLACICSILLIMLLIPLFITSFQGIRKRMAAKTWKKIQRIAYVFYGLIYLHILFFRMPAIQERDPDAIVSVCLYSILFFGYTALRLLRFAEEKKKDDLRLPIQLGILALMCVLLVFLFLPAKESVSRETVNTSAKEETVQGEEAADTREKPGVQEEPVQGEEAAGTRKEPGVQEEPVLSEDAAGIPEDSEANENKWVDGTYTGSAIGYNGKLKVSVTIAEGSIADIELKSHVEDEPYVTRAVDGIFPAITEGTPIQEIDAVSTATTTSQALKEAVEEALKEAGEQAQ